jgi:ribose/xylose/arabinose/galactoside ABC-type transport system permease subunit
VIRLNIAFVIMILAVLGAIDLLGYTNAYDLNGHGKELSLVVKFTMALLALTHVFLCIIMAAQHRRWTPSESAMFRFIAIKAAFWAWWAWHTPIRESGISVPTIFFLVVLCVTTIDLDIRLFGRYILGWEDEKGSTPGTSWSSGDVPVRDNYGTIDDTV